MEKVVRKRTEHLVVRTKELELERARTQKLLKGNIRYQILNKNNNLI